MIWVSIGNGRVQIESCPGCLQDHRQVNFQRAANGEMFYVCPVTETRVYLNKLRERKEA